MKNILLFLIGVICINSAIAQPTLTGATMNPVAGETFYGFSPNDTTGISKGAAGAGVTWNFARLDTGYMDTTTYVTCASTPFCDSFPGSTIAFYDGTDYYYYITDATKLAASGVGEPASTGGACVYYTNLQNELTYPNTYNTISVDTFVESQPAFSFSSAGVDSFIADAYGTLTLPSGTYTNVLRIHEITYESDVFTLSGGLGDTSTYRTESYTWYQSGFHNPLLVMDYDTSGSITYLSYVEYYAATPTDTTHPSGIKSIVGQSPIQVYPNPANDIVHIQFTSTVSQQITIIAIDMLGREVGQRRMENVTTGSNQIDYNVAGFAPGVYYLRVKTADNTYVQKVQVAR